MSGKKKKGRARVSCLGCAARMRDRDVACRKCGHPRMAMAGKSAAPAFTGKAMGGARVVPLMTKSAMPATWPCPCGHRLGRNATRCSHCGRVGGPGALKSAGQASRFVGKSASGPRCPSCFKVQGPGYRHCADCGELMPSARPLLGKGAASVQYSDQFWREPNPATRELLWRLMHGQDTGGAA